MKLKEKLALEHYKPEDFESFQNGGHEGFLKGFEKALSLTSEFFYNSIHHPELRGQTYSTALERGRELILELGEEEV